MHSTPSPSTAGDSPSSVMSGRNRENSVPQRAAHKHQDWSPQHRERNNQSSTEMIYHDVRQDKAPAGNEFESLHRRSGMDDNERTLDASTRKRSSPASTSRACVLTKSGVDRPPESSFFMSNELGLLYFIASLCVSHSRVRRRGKCSHSVKERRVLAFK
jgi:hypothetical protein